MTQPTYGVAIADAGLGYSPRAKTTNVRTREQLRRWGIADALRQASPIPPDFAANVVFATRMNGPLRAAADLCRGAVAGAPPGGRKRALGTWAPVPLPDAVNQR